MQSPPFSVDWQPVLLTLRLAAASTIVLLLLGTPLALWLAFGRSRLRVVVEAVVALPLVLPPTVLGYYILVAVGNSSVIGRAWESMFGAQIVFSFTGAVIAAAVGSLPLVVRAVRVALEAIEPNLISAARTLGARPGRVLFTVVLPLSAPGIVAGGMMGFARALGDYGATLMVAGAKIDGFPTASIFVMDQLLAGNDDQVFAMSAATTVFGVAMLYFANRVTRRFHLHR
jgi:molybdate transport system permease protein